MQKIEFIYADTNDFIKKINNLAIKKQLFILQDILARIITYLRDHPEKVPLVHKHMDFYLEKTMLFAHYYIDLEETMLDTPDIQNAKNNILEILIDFEKAYEILFTKIMSPSLLELDASLTVANDILNENNIK